MGTYKNVMELLTEEAVERQLKQLPSRVTAYIKADELVAYALNQLPSLYATTEKGLKYQLRRGRSHYRQQIDQAVQRAIAAVQRDPIRSQTPLSDVEQKSQKVLQRMRALFQDDSLNWDTVPSLVEQALRQDKHQPAAGTELYATSHRQQAWNELDQPPRRPPSVANHRPWRHPFADRLPDSTARQPLEPLESQTSSTINLDVVPQPVTRSPEEFTDWGHPLSQL
ncbi:MAG: hypothetical protein EA367_13115 [Leptolyngbya sp. DLM2.Bin15]|nr:MAG: hypothetical protein EA367_13115 [Leptolyngbya sp. DLM2.Bin15]